MVQGFQPGCPCPHAACPLAEALGLSAKEWDRPGVRRRVRMALDGPECRGRVAAYSDGLPARARHELCLLGMECRLGGYRRHLAERLDDGRPEQGVRATSSSSCRPE